MKRVLNPFAQTVHHLKRHVLAFKTTNTNIDNNSYTPRVLILGAGLSGRSCAKACVSENLPTTLTDDRPDHLFNLPCPGLLTRDLLNAPHLDFDLLVLSPSVIIHGPKTHPLVLRARKEGLAITSDTDLFFACLPPEAKLINVSGTNGKSSTVSLTQHILNQLAPPALAIGNIGQPFFDVRLETPSTTLVTELSSYQLEKVESLTYDVALLLPLTPDHLEHHGQMEAYVAAKLKLFEKGRPQSSALYAFKDSYQEPYVQKNDLHRFLAVCFEETKKVPLVIA